MRFMECQSPLEFVTCIYVGAREWHKGQSMTEYAMILAAVGIVVFSTYKVLGQDVNALVKSIGTDLAT